MTGEDREQLIFWAREWITKERPVIGCSSMDFHDAQPLLLEAFPSATIVQIDGASPGSVDLDAAYVGPNAASSKDATVYLDRAIIASSIRIIQGHVQRWRGGWQELCPEIGDAIRWSLPGNKSKIDDMPELNREDGLEKWHVYRSGVWDGKIPEPISFIALLRRDMVGT